MFDKLNKKMTLHLHLEDIRTGSYVLSLIMKYIIVYFIINGIIYECKLQIIIYYHCFNSIMK